jgi:hypothetical protein
MLITRDRMIKGRYPFGIFHKSLRSTYSQKISSKLFNHFGRFPCKPLQLKYLINAIFFGFYGCGTGPVQQSTDRAGGTRSRTSGSGTGRGALREIIHGDWGGGARVDAQHGSDPAGYQNSMLRPPLFTILKPAVSP